MEQVTLVLGTKNKTELLDKMVVTDWAKQQLQVMELTTVERIVNLEIYTGLELGFIGIATRKEIYDAGLALGLSLCPAEVAFYLRDLVATMIAMEPIMDKGLYPRIFQTTADPIDPRFCAVYAPSGQAELVWGDFYRWAFLRD